MGRGRRRPRPLILDTGALVLVDRATGRGRALAEELAAVERLVVSAAVVAQAWRPPGTRRALLARLLSLDSVEVAPLDRSVARPIGELLAASGTSDVVDAHVALLGSLHDGTVLTSDPDDLAALGARVVAL